MERALDSLATVRRRLDEQRLVGAPAADVGEAVRWLGAVQAQEFAEAKWSLAERTEACADADVEGAFARGEIIRTHVLRPTWHFVSPDDLRWLLRLTRPRVHALNRYWYRKFELSPDLLSRGHDVIARSLADGAALTRAELAERLVAAGIEADGLRLGYLLMYAELEELICSGPRRGKQQTYALLDTRVGRHDLDDLPRDRALDELAVRYFRSHGPATIRDFTAWSSLTVTDTKAALERIAGRLERVEDDTGRAWYAAPAQPRATSTRAKSALLIPMYDETIVAYQDLRVVLAHESPRPGLLDRCIVIDGRTYGSWKRTLSVRSVVVTATLFGPISDAGSGALAEVAERFGRFLGVPAVVNVRLAM